MVSDRKFGGQRLNHPIRPAASGTGGLPRFLENVPLLRERRKPKVGRPAEEAPPAEPMPPQALLSDQPSEAG